MKKVYTLLAAALTVSVAVAQTTVTTDNFTAVKGNQVVKIHEASTVTSIKFVNGNVVGYDKNGGQVFSQPIADIDNLKLEPVPAIKSTILEGEGLKVARISLENGEIVEFGDIEGLDLSLQPHFFTDATATSAKFTGIDGTYDFHLDANKHLAYLMNADMKHPETLWICGEGYGHPSEGAVSGCSWAMDQVQGTPMAKKISDGVYEISLYLGNDFKFLFFKTRGDWGSGLNRLAVATYPEDIFGIGYFDDENTGYGHFTGDFVPGKNFTPGVYSLQIDTNKGVGVVVGQASLDDIQGAPRKINGVKLTNTYEGYVGAELHLTQGEEVTFEGIAMLDKALHPDYFDVLDGKAYFKAASGRYILNYKTDRGIVYCEPADVNQGLWITGQGLGHPCQSLASYDYCNWGFENPKDYIVLPEVSTGVYQGTVLLGNQPDLVNWEHNGYRFGFQFQIYDGKANWNSNYGATTCDIVAEGDARVGLAAADFFNFLPLPGFTPGLYNIKVDTNNHSEGKRATVTFTRATHDLYLKSAKVNNIDLSYIVKGTSRYLWAEMDLTSGQEVSFEGISNLATALSPDYFNVTDGKATFVAPSGKYYIFYQPTNGLVYCFPEYSDSVRPTGYWLNGQRFGHPGVSTDNLALSDWGFEDPLKLTYLVPTPNGTFKGTVFLDNNFMFQIFDKKNMGCAWNDDWNAPYVYTNVTVVNENGAHIGSLSRNTENPSASNPNFGTDSPEGGFVPGVYTVELNTSNNTVTFNKIQ